MELKEIIRQGYLELSKNGTVHLHDIVTYLKEVHGISASFGKAHREVMDLFYEVENEVENEVIEAREKQKPNAIPAYTHPATGYGACIAEAAAILCESVETVQLWIKIGKLTAFRAPSKETGQEAEWLERDQLYAINIAKNGGFSDYGQSG